MKKNKAIEKAPRCTICVDMGTTNTRVWLVSGKKIVARQNNAIGIRDSARSGNTDGLRTSLRTLLKAVQKEANRLECRPILVLGAGMITSPLGLMEIDHVLAPAGALELSQSMKELVDEALTDLPILLVPGVRTGPRQPTTSDLADLDLIRGEETLCIGLTQLELLSPNSTLLNLGSHWKAITLDEKGRIASSFTTLSGELIQAVQQNTVLAGSLPQERLTEIDSVWLEKGRHEEEAGGLPRALFCVRILHQRFKLTPVQLSSFFLGAVVSADLQAIRKNKKLGENIVIAGTGAPAEAWKRFLEKDRPVTVASAQIVEDAFVTGLLHIAELHLPQMH